MMKFNRNLYNSYSGRRLLKLPAIALGALVISVNLLSGANASDLRQPEKKTIELYMKKYQRNHTFFYSGNKMEGKVKVSSTEYFKGAPYICTPSGFGRTSHCYARSTY